jgi:hypothetical protein
MKAKIYHRSTVAGSVWVVMSPDGNEFKQFSYCSAAALHCMMEGWDFEVEE